MDKLEGTGGGAAGGGQSSRFDIILPAPYNFVGGWPIYPLFGVCVGGPVLLDVVLRQPLTARQLTLLHCEM